MWKGDVLRFKIIMSWVENVFKIEKEIDKKIKILVIIIIKRFELWWLGIESWWMWMIYEIEN